MELLNNSILKFLKEQEFLLKNYNLKVIWKHLILMNLLRDLQKQYLIIKI